MAYYRKNLYTGEEEWVDIKPEERFDSTDKTPQHGRYFGANGWARGVQSDGLGVHPSQVAEFNEDARKAGLTGVYFDKDGTCHLSSREQRRKYCEHRGYFDRDGGYGDASPRNF